MSDTSDNPNITFIQLLKKKVGVRRYKITTKKIARIGKRSKKKLKNKNSAMKKIEPGKPRKIKQLPKITRKSLGQRKLIPLISVIRRVLNLLFIESTSKKEFVEIRA